MIIRYLFLSFLFNFFVQVKGHAGFFRYDEVKRRAILENSESRLPHSFLQYFCSVAESDFFRDLRSVVAYFRESSEDISGNKFLQAFGEYLLTDYAEQLDQKICSELRFSSYQEISEEIFLFLKALTHSKYTVIQTPRVISPALRSRMRQHLTKSSFPIFQVDSTLLGGFRLFMEGTMHDTSWLHTLNTLLYDTSNTSRLS